MFAFRLILLCFSIFFSQAGMALDSKDILPPEQAFVLSAKAVAADRLELAWEISPGYHLYRDKFKFQSQTDSIQLGQIDLPPGNIEHDAVFGDMAVYRGAIKLEIPLLNNNQDKQIKLLVKYQGCADIGVCYPPQKAVLELPLPAEVPAGGGNVLNKFTQGFKSLAPDLFHQELLPPEQAFQFIAEVKNDHTLHVTWLVAEGYYLYKDRLGLSLEASAQDSLGKYSLPLGESHHDPEFGQVEIYRHEVSAEVPLIRHGREAETIVLTAKYQGCADRGVCYPPMHSSISLAVPAAVDVASASVQEPPLAAAESEQDKIVASLKQDGFALTLLSFFGFGLLLAFTPCIFPMIPILSGIIVGQGDGITTRKAFLLSLSYVLASALMYTLFGILAAVFGGNLQAAFQEPWVIAAFSGLFVVLSLSMFGFYNLELPASLQTYLSRVGGRHRDGSYLGAGIMGALSSLIVGPCVAAPLAAALIYIGQTGDALLGGSALFAMGLGMGLPLLLLGASAARLLPKAGAWMNATKAAFGVIMLAVALWMLSRILPAAATMLLSALLLIIPAVYLSAVDSLPIGASGWRKFYKGVGIVMLTFGILQLIGLGAGSRNLFQPLQGIAAGIEVQAKTGLEFQRVRNLAELESRLKQAAEDGKPAMLDFYADWCVSCKEMEAYTFTDSKVRKALADYVLLQADVTENNADDKALLKRFELIGPPGIIFFAADGKEKAAKRVIGFQDAAAFIRTLQP